MRVRTVMIDGHEMRVEDRTSENMKWLSHIGYERSPEEIEEMKKRNSQEILNDPQMRKILKALADDD